jgi:hypothetical protein
LKKILVSEDVYDTTQTLMATSRARLEQARERLSHSQLRAPFNGSVAFYALPSEVVASTQPILYLQDISFMRPCTTNYNNVKILTMLKQIIQASAAHPEVIPE